MMTMKSYYAQRAVCNAVFHGFCWSHVPADS